MQVAHNPRPQTASHYPNAADRHYFIEKFTDALLSAAICVGVVTIAFFLITMF